MLETEHTFSCKLNTFSKNRVLLLFTRITINSMYSAADSDLDILKSKTIQIYI